MPASRPRQLPQYQPGFEPADKYQPGFEPADKYQYLDTGTAAPVEKLLRGAKTKRPRPGQTQGSTQRAACKPFGSARWRLDSKLQHSNKNKTTTISDLRPDPDYPRSEQPFDRNEDKVRSKSKPLEAHVNKVDLA